MFLGILTLITALTISAVAIYYSVAGLVAIFAAAAIPIMLMGGILEIGKLVTAVWLHYYWNQSPWWLKTYLSLAVIVLMFITSMGIFGFLSKAHIEQTAGATEGIAQLERIDTEIGRQQLIIQTANQRIEEAESSVGKNNESIQQQIDIEQERIDTAYSRVQPAIDEQNAIIEAARLADSKRTEPFEQQLVSLEEELRRLNNQVIAYEQRLTELTVDTSAVEPILSQIANIEENISLVQGQLAGGERQAIQAAQRTIGVNDDGSAGPNTRRAADAWITTQRDRILQLQSQIVDLQNRAQETVDAERLRLTNLISAIEGPQTSEIKSRQAEILMSIDNIRATESPVIQSARDEIARIRSGADIQIAQSNELIQNLRNSLTVGRDAQVETIIQDQNNKIIEANNTIDTLTQQKYQLEIEYRKLEAEVGPIKYLAEFIYGNTADKDLLEEAVRWVIITIIFVFDPLAVLLLIASQYTFEFAKNKKKVLESNDQKWKDYETARAQLIVANKGYDVGSNHDIEKDIPSEINRTRTDGGDTTQGMAMADQGTNEIETSDTEIKIPQTDSIEVSDEEIRKNRIEELEKTQDHRSAKLKWKTEHPDQNLKFWKDQYIKGKIDELPWENQSYQQNEEQTESSIWNQIRKSNE